MRAQERMEHLEMWKKTIEEASSSGIGIRIWCQENGVSASQYYYWHKVLVDEGMISRRQKASDDSGCSTKASRPVFAEINLGQSSAFQPVAQAPFGYVLDSQVVIQRNDCKIYVGEGFSASTLSRVLEVIGNAS